MTQSKAEKETCLSCRLPRAQLCCETCLDPICKHCVQYVDQELFTFDPEVPTRLKHTVFCPRCYDSQVSPEIEIYNETLERARDVSVITKAYRGWLPVLKKSKTGVKVEGCTDRDELIMRLAYMGARDGYNALVQSEFVAKKVRTNGYQKTEWSGQAIPAKIDQTKLDDHELREEIWRRGA